MVDVKKRNWFIQRNYWFDTHDKNGELISPSHIADEFLLKKWNDDSKWGLYFTSYYNVDVKPYISEENWKLYVAQKWQSIDGIKQIAMIFHDEDFEQDTLGNVKHKPLHAHAVVMFKNARRDNTIRTDFGISSNKENAQPVNDMGSTLRYLTHRSENAILDGKHAYDFELVITKNCDYKEMINKYAPNKTKKVDEDLVDTLGKRIQLGEITPSQAYEEVEDHYSEDSTEAHKMWRQYHRTWEEDRQKYLQDKFEKMKNGDRGFSTVYIQGRGATGKSQLAKYLAINMSSDSTYYNAPAPSPNKTYDMLGGYTGEDITVVNEFDKSDLGFTEFLNNFDPHQVPMVSSRNKDKKWISTMAIATGSEDFHKIIIDMLRFTRGNSTRYSCGYSDEDKAKLWEAWGAYMSNNDEEFRKDYEQTVRRFTFVVKLEHDNNGHGDNASIATVYHYDGKEFVEIGSSGCRDVGDKNKCRFWATSIKNIFESINPKQFFDNSNFSDNNVVDNSNYDFVPDDFPSAPEPNYDDYYNLTEEDVANFPV